MAAAIWRHCPKYKSKIYYWEVPMCEWEMREWTVGSVLPKTSLSSCAPARQWYCHSPPRYTHICVLRSVLHSTQWWNCVSGILFSGWVSLSICFSTFFFLLFPTVHPASFVPVRVDVSLCTFRTHFIENEFSCFRTCHRSTFAQIGYSLDDHKNIK